MGEENTSGGGTGVTPQSPPTPVTGTPAAPGSVTPQTAALSHEDAMKRLADLERSLNNAKEENDRHSKNLTAREKELAVYKQQEEAAKLAALSDVEKANKRAADLEAQLKQHQKQLILEKVVNAAHKKGIIDPELAALAVQDSLEFGDDGMPSNLDKALDALVKAKPFLVAKPAEPAAQPTTPAQTAQPQQAPAVPAFALGRSAIQSPATGAQPGKPTRWNEVPWKS